MEKRAWLWLGSLVVVALMSAAMLAQNRFSDREPRIVSGSDVGFRVERTDASGRPVGTWLVRIDGEWVEVSPAPVVRRVN